VIRARHALLLACVFVAMIGLGITLPVLAFYVERLAGAAGPTPNRVVMHVVLLTSVYPLSQLVFAPVWGRWSDRVGRRPVLLAGLAGYVLAQIGFGLATSLWTLYAARVLGGMLSSAVLPVAAAYVADTTTDAERGRGMASMSAATSLGFVVGPGLGGMLVRQDLHWEWGYGHLMLDGFSVPFFVAAALALLALAAATAWLPESLVRSSLSPDRQEADWRTLLKTLSPLLGLTIAAQFALGLFEATFAFHGRAILGYGPAEIGRVFVVCGLVMALGPLGAMNLLAGRLHELHQIGAGFGLMGVSLMVMMVPRGMLPVLALVGLLALGMALIGPNLSVLISARSDRRGVGTAMGTQTAANSIGQALGPLIGGALFTWDMNAPYVLSGSLLIACASLIAWTARRHGNRSGARS
jgi:DHA1 family multidrug resistance protein-like MFS transporter